MKNKLWWKFVSVISFSRQLPATARWGAYTRTFSLPSFFSSIFHSSNIYLFLHVSVLIRCRLVLSAACDMHCAVVHCKGSLIKCILLDCDCAHHTHYGSIRSSFPNRQQTTIKSSKSSTSSEWFQHQEYWLKPLGMNTDTWWRSHTAPLNCDGATRKQYFLHNMHATHV